MAMWFLPKRNWAKLISHVLETAYEGDVIVMRSDFARECVKNFIETTSGGTKRLKVSLVPSNSPRPVRPGRGDAVNSRALLIETDDRAH